MLLALLMWGVSGDWALKQKIVFEHPVSRLIWIFVGYALLSCIYSEATSQNLVQSLKDIFRLSSIPVLMYYFYSPKKARLALWLFVAAMVVTFILAVLKVYADIPIGHKFNYTNGAYQVSSAVFKSHIKTNFFMVIATFFLAHQAITLPRYRGILLLVITCFCFYIFYMSWGRTGYVLFGILALILIWQALKSWHRVIAGLMLGLTLLCVYISSETTQYRLHQLVQDLNVYDTGGSLATSSLGSRLTFYQNSVTLIKAQPWFGSGLGSFPTRYQEAFPAGFLTDNPHNEYFLITVELGMIGLMVLMLLFVGMLYYARKLAPDLGKTAQGFVLAFMLGCLANSWLMDFTEGSFFVLMIALLFGHYPLKDIKFN
jgi:O-antigen ligase